MMENEMKLVDFLVKYLIETLVTLAIAAQLFRYLGTALDKRMTLERGMTGKTSWFSKYTIPVQIVASGLVFLGAGIGLPPKLSPIATMEVMTGILAVCAGLVLIFWRSQRGKRRNS